MTTMTAPGMELSEAGMVVTRAVTPAYHQSLRIPLVAGRYFTDADRNGGRPVAILSASTAKRYFPREDPIGRAVSLDGERVVVGVVADVRQLALEVDSWLEAYLPMAQHHVAGAELVVRTSGDPYDVVPAVRAAVYASMPDVPLRNVRTMEELVARGIAQRKFSMMLLGLFGVLGLSIAAVGLYGVLAHVVSQRTREIGVRVALGATRSSIVRLVVSDASRLVLLGLAAGSVVAWWASAAAEAFLFRLQPTDPRAFAAAIATLVAAASVAAAIPAWRTARVDPVEALRVE